MPERVPIDQLKQQAKEAIAEDLASAIGLIQGHLPKRSAKLNGLLLLKARFKTHQQNKTKGVVSYEQSLLIDNQLRDDLLRFVDALTHPDLVEPGPSLESQHRAMFSKLDCINCDRKEVVRTFWARFRQQQTYACHHYFLVAPREQHPHSLVERLIYELETDGKLVRYECKTPEHIVIDPFPQSVDLEGSRFEIKKALQRKFGHFVDRLEGLMDHCRYVFEYDYVVRAFHLGAGVEDWKPFTYQLFDWLIGNFCHMPLKRGTTFLFFYIVYMEPAYPPKGILNKIPLFSRRNPKPGAPILNQLVGLEKKYPEYCTVLPPLKRVPRKDFEQWIFEKVTNNAFESQRLVDKIIAELDDSMRKNVVSEEGFLMAFVEAKMKELIRQRS